MNREIKFRAWVNTYNGKEMLYDYCYLNPKENHFYAEDLTNDRGDVGKIFEVMQFTGRKDKNGKDIYEGDFDIDGNIVVWCDKCNGWEFGAIDIPTNEIVINCHRCDGNFFFEDQINDFVIFSNVHQNSKI